LSFYKEKWEDSRKDYIRELDFSIIPSYETAYITRALSLNLIKSDNLIYFYTSLIFISSPLYPNYTLKYSVFNNLDSPLIKSLSPFIRTAWATLLEKYPGKLPKLIDGIITYRCKIGFIGPHNRHISKNLSTALLDALKIMATLLEDLKLKWVL
jgi:hypothetical protein